MTTATTTTTPDLSFAEINGRGWIETIAAAYEAHQFCCCEGEGRSLSREAKAALKAKGYDGTNYDDVAGWIEDEMREAPLSVCVRCSEWQDPCEPQDLQPDEFQILLSTGGPALRIVGKLDRCEPSRCWLEIQDWGTPWTRMFTQHEYESDALRWFAGLFYYGEG